jgi:hypothetical protein
MGEVSPSIHGDLTEVPLDEPIERLDVWDSPRLRAKLTFSNRSSGCSFVSGIGDDSCSRRVDWSNLGCSLGLISLELVEGGDVSVEGTPTIGSFEVGLWDRTRQLDDGSALGFATTPIIVDDRFTLHEDSGSLSVDHVHDRLGY